MRAFLGSLIVLGFWATTAAGQMSPRGGGAFLPQNTGGSARQEAAPVSQPAAGNLNGGSYPVSPHPFGASGARSAQSNSANPAGADILVRSPAAVGVNPTTVYDWRRSHYEFDDQIKAARKAFVAVLETEVYRRAVEGVEKPVFGRGPGKDAGTVVVGRVREYSDKLLTLMLQANAPKKYRTQPKVERRKRPMLEQGGTGGFAKLFKRLLAREIEKENDVPRLSASPSTASE